MGLLNRVCLFESIHRVSLGRDCRRRGLWRCGHPVSIRAGGPHVSQSFRTRRWPGALKWLRAVAVVCFGILAVELYRVAIPFQSVNPLWQEATVDEPVIGNWRYGGQDEEGYLRFFDQAQTVLMPPGSHLFGADGQFVVIEHYSPSSLTFAQPYEAIPPLWLILGLGVGVISVAVAVRRWRRRRLRLRAVRPSSSPVQRQLHWRGKARRFKSARRR